MWKMYRDKHDLREFLPTAVNHTTIATSYPILLKYLDGEKSEQSQGAEGECTF